MKYNHVKSIPIIKPITTPISMDVVVDNPEFGESGLPVESVRAGELEITCCDELGDLFSLETYCFFPFTIIYIF